MSPSLLDSLTKLHHSDGLNVYLTDSLTTELQCQLFSRIVHGITLTVCKQLDPGWASPALPDRDTVSNNGVISPVKDVSEMSQCTVLLDSSMPNGPNKGQTESYVYSHPSASCELGYEQSEEFWDVHLDPSLVERKPEPPRFPLHMPPPLPFISEKASVLGTDEAKHETDCNASESRRMRDFVRVPSNPRKLFVGNINYRVRDVSAETAD